MATLEPNSDEVTKIFAKILELLAKDFENITDAAYALQLATYFLCKNGLFMTDADYMGFCQTLMHHNMPFVAEHSVVFVGDGEAFVKKDSE